MLKHKIRLAAIEIMKFTNLKSAALLTVALLLTACNETNPDPKNFIETAARGNLTEVQVSRIALQRSQNSEIKSFAQEMIEHHTAATNELAEIAGKKGVNLPREVSSSQSSQASRLEQMNGEAFDKQFVNVMLDDHNEDVKLFQTNANSSQDADIKAFAAKNLPALEAHLQRVKDLKAKMPQ